MDRFQGNYQDGSSISNRLEASQSWRVRQVENVDTVQGVIEPHPAVVFSTGALNSSGQAPMSFAIPVVNGYPALINMGAIDSGPNVVTEVLPLELGVGRVASGVGVQVHG